MYFPQDEVGRNRKLSRPWHGPYRVLEKKDPDITLCKVYFPLEKNIQVHQTRVQPCPMNFPAGCYWYGSKRAGPGCPPKWVDRLMTTDEPMVNQDDNDLDDGNAEEFEPESETIHTELDYSDRNKAGTNVTMNQNSDTRKMKKTRTRTIIPPARYQSDYA